MKNNKRVKLSSRLTTGRCALTVAALWWVTGLQAQPAGSSTSTPSGSGSGATSGTTTPGTSGARSGSSIASDPNPYYLGVSESFTHDTNVYRIQNGPSDTFWSTSLFGGFDQPISRQRLFGRASVSANRYQNESTLNNTSYNLAAGWDWATIEKLSGNLNVGLSRNLAAPATIVGTPQASRNVANTRSIDARARWGGDSLLTLEGTLGYSRVDYSEAQFVASEYRQTSSSLGLFYRPGGRLRLGMAARFNRSESPGGLQFQSVRSKNLDLLADYGASGLISANGRLSYTRQTISSTDESVFSGLTGGLSLVYQPSGKLGYNFNWARDAGASTAPYYNYLLNQSGPITVLTPLTGLYQTNQVTDSFGVGVSYAATAKISANAGVRYARAKLQTRLFGQSGSDTTDVVKGVYLGANYDIGRGWSSGCWASHENRDVSGGATYSYGATTLGCQAGYTWR